MRRMVIATVTAAVVSLLAATSGVAKGYPLVFDRVSAEPGDIVVAAVPGTPSGYVADRALSGPGIRVYLVAVADAGKVRRFLPVDPRLVEVGTFQGLLGYRGSVRFEVPQLRPGPYTTAVRIRGVFYVTRPAFKREYVVRGRLVLRIRAVAR
jgi:hypothetical protein